ncbi:MAG TPA: ATP-binding protein [Gammaproteobacteria bacterium]
MKVGLHGKLLIGLLALVTFTLAVMGYVLVYNADSRLEQFRKVQAEYQARTLADAVLDALLTDDFEVLRGWVNAAIPSDDYAYAALIRPNGQVLTHTDIDLIGFTIPTIAGSESVTVRTTRYKNRLVKEIINPIFVGQKHLASSHVAYYLDQQSMINDDSIPIIVIAVVFALIVLSLGSYVITRRLVNPLNDLSDAVSRVSADKYLVLDSTTLKRQDEVGTLARTFQDMSARLMDRLFELELSRKKLQLEVDARQKATSANETKSAFLANMSHELRTPLNAIIGYSEILAEDFDETHHNDSLNDIRRIKDAAMHLLQLINDVLDLSKIEAGKLELSYSNFSLNTLIREVATTVKPLVDKNNNRLEINCFDANIDIWADNMRLRQILLNLLSNASKFTSNGSIKLEVDKKFQNWKDWIIIKVTDQGIGMTPEQMGRIFDAFSQADSSTAGKFGGTGLGLSISQLLCQKMDGEITVESWVNKGSVFTVWLPHKKANPESIKHAV